MTNKLVSRLNRFAAILVSFWDIGMTIMIFVVWVFAWMQGGTTTVPIDKYGEAEAELIMWVLFWPIYIYGKVQDLDLLFGIVNRVRRKRE